MFNSRKHLCRMMVGMLLIAALLQTTPLAFAATTARVDYDAATESITVRLTTDKLHKSAALTVQSNGRYYILAEFERRSKTNFSYSCQLPKNMPSGTYKAVVTIGGEATEVSFSHINQTMAAQALLNVNQATKETFATVIEENGSELAVDVIEFKQYEALIKELFFLYRPEGDLTIETFSALYQKSLLLAQMKGETDTSKIETLLSDYATRLEFDITAFEALEAEAKEEIIRRFQEGVYVEKNLSDEYVNWFALAEINLKRDNSVQTYRTAIFETYETLLALDLTDYEKSADCDEVIRLVMESSYDSIKALQDAFYAAVRQVGKAGSGSSGSSSSSSHGGGSGGGGGGRVNAGGLVRWNSETPTDTTEMVDSGFSDIAPSHWCAQAAKALSDSGIISGVGDGRFLPDQAITRAEFSKMLWIALYGKTSVDGKAIFVDVNESDWFCGVVSAAYEKGLIHGDTEGYFYPNNAISRQDMAVMIARGLASFGLAHNEKALSFTDEESIAAYAKEAVAELVNRDILTGMADGSFQPNGVLSRAQAAKALYETMRACGRLS